MQGDPQAGAQDTSAGVHEDGGEMAGDQTHQSEDAASAQTRQGAATSEDAKMEDHAPLRGVPLLWKSPTTSNVLQTEAHIAWLAPVMGLREGEAQAPPST